MAILEQLLAPVTLTDFSQNYFRKNPYAVPSKAHFLKNFVSWYLIEEILATGHNDCWLPFQGKLPQDPNLAQGTLNWDQARTGFSQGRTVLIRHSEKAHPVLAAVARDFFNVWGFPVDAFFNQEEKRTEWRCWLKEGDWLYIPAGYWHKAQAVTESWHMSVGVMSS